MSYSESGVGLSPTPEWNSFRAAVEVAMAGAHAMFAKRGEQAYAKEIEMVIRRVLDREHAPPPLTHARRCLNGPVGSRRRSIHQRGGVKCISSGCSCAG